MTRSLFVLNDAPCAVCGTRMDDRGMTETKRPESARRPPLEELSHWAQDADKVLVY